MTFRNFCVAYCNNYAIVVAFGFVFQVLGAFKRQKEQSWKYLLMISMGLAVANIRLVYTHNI